jgi:SNF2 family DNA or RNA helicase
MKEDVELSIPLKEETIVELEMTSIQKNYYRAMLDRNRDFLSRGNQLPSQLLSLE